MGFLCSAIVLLVLYKLFLVGKNVIWPFLLAKHVGFKDYLKRIKGWAVVTGATDGIGKAYALALAKRGFKVLLISRTQERLDATAKEIRTETGVEVDTLAFDFGKNDTVASYDVIQTRLDQIEVGILINNVGVGYDYPEYYLDVPGGREAIRNLLFVNEFSALMMTHIALKQMVDRKQGVIVNVSSATGLEPFPMLAVYSAAKAFLQRFTQGLRAEYAGKGVYFQTIYPYYVVSKLSGLKRSSFFNRMPDDFVEEALGTIGVTGETCGCFAHCLQHEIYGLVPCFLKPLMIKKVLLDVRKRKLQKQQKTE